MEYDINILANGRQPQYFGKWKPPQYFIKWKTTPIFWQMVDNLNMLRNGRQTQLKIEDNINFGKKKMTSIFGKWKMTSMVAKLYLLLGKIGLDSPSLS
jgi:hypothetical protein